MNILSFPSIQPKYIRILGFSHSHTNKRHPLLDSFSLFGAGPSLRLTCSATAMSAVEICQAFDSQKASLLVNDLRNTFKSGKTKSYEWRIRQIKSLLQMVEEREKDIIGAIQIDLAKPELEAFISEISLTKGECKKVLKELKRWMAPEKVKTTIATYPSSAEIVSEPLGVVLVISAWNYPFLLSIKPVIGAIAAGNAVVLKPSEIAPASSKMLAKLLGEYLDTDAIRVVEGAVPETTALLDQKWDKIFYTGSGRIGRIVMAAAVKHLTPVTLELGGKSPAIVDSTVNLQVAVRRIIAGKWGCNNGQACIGIDYLITTKSFAPILVDALKRGISECFGENPIESKDISGIVSSYHFNRLTRLLDEDRVPERVVIGGQRDEELRKIAPTVLFDVPEDTQIMQEEIFGPLLPIVTVDNIEDGFDIINSKPKPLAAYLFSNNENLKQSFVQDVSSGGMLINDAVLHLTVPGLPFGGVGESGMGAYHGKFSFDTFSHKKSVMYRSFNGDSTLRYPPFTAKKQRLLKAVMNGSIIEVILVLFGWSK